MVGAGPNCCDECCCCDWVCYAPNRPIERPCRHASILLPGTESWQLHYIYLILVVKMKEDTVLSYASWWLFWNSTYPDIVLSLGVCAHLYHFVCMRFVFHYDIYICVVSSYTEVDNPQMRKNKFPSFLQFFCYKLSKVIAGVTSLPYGSRMISVV